MAKKITALPGDLLNLSNQVKNRIADIVPRVIAAEGQRHFEMSWQNQGFTDNTLSKWRKRQFNQKRYRKDRAPTAAYKKFQAKDRGRAILVSHQTDTKGTHLKDSIRTTWDRNKVEFATDKVYAQVHNEGGHAGRGKGFEMPQRQFMGPSEALDKAIEAKLDREITKMLDNIKF